MRQAIGSTWIFQLVIIFILIFVSFLILTLTYSKSYKTKNELLNIIEKHEGVNEESVAIINNYLNQTGYRYMHSCPHSTADVGWMGSDNLEGDTLERVNGNKKYYYCIRKHSNSKKKGSNAANKNLTMYYEVMIFFKFNLPVINNIGTFTTNGTTNDIFNNPDIFSKTGVGSV